MTRAVMWLLLAVVAAAAAVLSLKDLASACGFSSWTAPLLPIVLDAGCAAGTLAWLTRSHGMSFGRVLGLTLLSISVLGNSIGHYLASYHLAPGWAVVVDTSALAPAILGAVTHLAFFLGGPTPEWPTSGLTTSTPRPLGRMLSLVYP